MKIPWWLGPGVGLVVGALAYLQFGPGAGQPFDLRMLAAFAGIGLLAGCALGLGDLISPPPRRVPRQTPLKPWQRTRYYAGVVMLVLGGPVLMLGALNTRDRGWTAYSVGFFAVGGLLLGIGFGMCRAHRGRLTRS